MVTQAASQERQNIVASLESWPLLDVLQWLHEQQRTAMVRIGAGLDAGVLFFSHGSLYRAEWGNLTGEHALMGLLGLQGGSVALIQREFPMPRPNIHYPTHELLLRCAIAFDERNRARGVA